MLLHVSLSAHKRGRGLRSRCKAVWRGPELNSNNPHAPCHLPFPCMQADAHTHNTLLGMGGSGAPAATPQSSSSSSRVEGTAAAAAAAAAAEACEPVSRAAEQMYTVARQKIEAAGDAEGLWSMWAHNIVVWEVQHRPDSVGTGAHAATSSFCVFLSGAHLPSGASCLPTAAPQPVCPAGQSRSIMGNVCAGLGSCFGPESRTMSSE